MSNFEEAWQAYLADRGVTEQELGAGEEFKEELDTFSTHYWDEYSSRILAQPGEQAQSQPQSQNGQQDQREREVERSRQHRDSLVADLDALQSERPAGWNLARPEHWEWENRQRILGSRLQLAAVQISRAEQGTPFADLTDEQLAELKDAKLLKHEELRDQIRPAGNDPNVPLRIKRLRKDAEAILEEATQVEAELHLRAEERDSQALVEFMEQRQRDEEEAIRETKKASNALEDAREKVVRLKSMPSARRELAIAELDLEDAQTHSREVYEKHGGKLPMNFGLTYMAPV